MKNVIKKIKNDKIINLVIEHVKKNCPDADIYIVGGAVRDFYLGFENFDKDIVIDKTNAQKFAKSLAKSIDASFVPLDEECQIYRLVLQDKVNIIDIAAPIGGNVGANIEEDLKRRDLTINSIAVNLKTFETLDLTDGLNDLKTRKIRQISEQNFIDDPLRLLRVYRFQSMLGFALDSELEKIVEKHREKIKEPAIERISYELLKLFAGKYCDKALLNINETGLLEEIFPTIKELKKVPPNLHHHLPLFEHSVEVVRQIQGVYEKSCDEVKGHLERVDFGGTSRLAHLKLAGFLHDIGKPSTWTIEQDSGKHRFIKHEDVGSKMAAEILKKMKFSKKQIEYIQKMVKYHIYPSHVVSALEINDKIYLRLIRKMENDVIDIVVLAMSDRLSARGVEITDEIVERNLNNLKNLLDFYISVKEGIKPLPKLLSGEEIMHILNLKPSKTLGNVVKRLHEAQLEGNVNTKEEAIIFVKSL